MRKIDRLKKEALEVCKARGHKMGEWTHLTYSEGYKNFRPRCEASAHCEECGAYVECKTRPMPNEIEIGGEAVAINCIKR